MDGFVAVEAAFAGFGHLRRHRRTVLILTLWAIGVWAIDTVITYAIGGGQPTLAEVMRAPGSYAPVILRQTLLILVDVAWGLAMRSTIMRGLVEGPEAGPRAGLRLAHPELRLLGVYAVLLLAFIAVSVVMLFLLSIPVLVAFAGGGLMRGRWIMALGAVPAMVVLMAVLGTRWSLAPFLAVAGRRRPLVESWKATRRPFWRLLCAYALILVALALVSAAITTSVTGVASLILVRQKLGFMDLLLAARRGAGPGMMGLQLVGRLAQSVLQPAVAVLSLAPGAIAYRLSIGEPGKLA